jgi:hypothetical protein
MAKRVKRAKPRDWSHLKKKKASKGRSKANSTKHPSKKSKRLALMARRRAAKSIRKNRSVKLEAQAGGNATAAGVSFQASVGAVFAVPVLAETKLDNRLSLGSAKPCGVRFESEAAVDDCSIETDAGGWIFVQAKTGLDLTNTAGSDLRKTSSQIVRLWHSTKDGQGRRGWDRPLVRSKDRILIAAGPNSSKSVTIALAHALETRRAKYSATLPQDQSRALAALIAALKAEWKGVTGAKASDTDIRALLPFIVVIAFDMAGADRKSSVAELAPVLTRTSAAANAFVSLEKCCQQLMETRLGGDAEQFRIALEGLGVSMKAPPRFEADVARLTAYSGETRLRLKEFEKISVSDSDIIIPRDVTGAVAEAAKHGSFLVIGEPGAGKSAVLTAAADALRKTRCDVIELAVDQFAVNTLDGITRVIGLENPLTEVLAHWPGNKAAYLLIDALDATRGGAGETAFRQLIDAVIRLPKSRWRVIASIRSFDLRMGEHFRERFRGNPPVPGFRNSEFGDVRHISVPAWSDAEFATLRAAAPPLDQALTRGGAKLLDLARVPFNTRLLAELIDSGASPETFNQVATQVELLAVYWRKRVEQHGSGAHLCLAAAVGEMVTARGLRARRMTAAAPDPAAFDLVLKDGVVTLLPDGQSVGFRHHILFDYAASRLFIDTFDIAATVKRLHEDRGLSLMLAPAIAFALQALWATDIPSRHTFWQAVCLFAGSPKTDPVAQSVAARIAAELPTCNADMRGLVSLFEDSSTRKAAVAALAHVAGAVAVRVDDHLPIDDGAWCYLAAHISNQLDDIAWSLRVLLFDISKRITDPAIRGDLGIASRAMLSYAFDMQNPGALLPLSIELVADTYNSDPAASRTLLSKALTPERMLSHAHEDIPAPARQAKTLVSADPSFLVEIFAVTFGYSVSDDSPTPLGTSQILPLTSTKRQGYDHAKWQLKEVVRPFLDISTGKAIQAISAALEGHTKRRYSNEELVRRQVGNGSVTIVADSSQIWASDPDDPHAHADNAAAILRAFKEKLEKANDADLKQLAEQTVQHAKAAALWARLFLVGSKRAPTLNAILWPYASDLTLLRMEETTRDATDFVAIAYPHVNEADRRSFEQRSLAVTFPDSSDPARSRLRFLGRLFTTIGAVQLVTEEARQLLQSEDTSIENRRPYQFITDWEDPSTRTHWLAEFADITAPPNANILHLTEQLEAATASLDQGLDAAEALASALTEADASLALRVRQYADGQLGSALSKFATQKDKLKAKASLADRLWRIVSAFLQHSSPADEPNKASELGPRASATEAALRLCALSQGMADIVLPALADRVDDPHAAVRFVVAKNIGCLWDYRRSDLWRIAKQFIEREANFDVLRGITGFLCRAVHHDIEQVEGLTLQLLPQAALEEDAHGDRIIEGLASILAVLWTQHERPRAKATIDLWLTEPENHVIGLGRIADTMRGHLVADYDAAKPDAAKSATVKLRRNTQKLAAEMVEKTAACLDDYYVRGDRNMSAAEIERVRACARLLDGVGDELYFSSGARSEGNEEIPLATMESRRALLKDMAAVLHRIGQVGIPHTIYYLIDMLEFLRPADPEGVFDLIANALLVGGARHGYQFESLATDLFTNIVGLYLADHRELFNDLERREKLVACLDLFVQAGWPSARRLLYRLPEVL